MKQRFMKWWKGSTMNEKLMYVLILLFLIGIAVQWEHVWGEISDAFSAIFNPSTEQ